MKFSFNGSSLVTIFFLVGIFFLQEGRCQNRIFKLPAHMDASKLTWWDSIYQFSDFQNGSITFFTGFSPDVEIKINYNLYFGRMDMINEMGDTVQLRPSKKIKLISVSDHQFIYDLQNGAYVEILTKQPISLGVLNVLSLDKMEFVSGNGAGSWQIDIRGQISVYDRYYREAAQYFFIDRNSKLYKPLMPSLLKLFSGHKRDIKDYIQRNGTDFNNRQDLERILDFCNQLSE